MKAIKCDRCDKFKDEPGKWRGIIQLTQRAEMVYSIQAPKTQGAIAILQDLTSKQQPGDAFAMCANCKASLEETIHNWMKK